MCCVGGVVVCWLVWYDGCWLVGWLVGFDLRLSCIFPTRKLTFFLLFRIAFIASAVASKFPKNTSTGLFRKEVVDLNTKSCNFYFLLG